MAPLPDDLPLLSGQASIWAAEQFGVAGTPYNFRWSLGYPGDQVAPRALEAAVRTACDLHPATRARVVSERGRPYARIDRPVEVHTHTATSDDPDGGRALADLFDGAGRSRFDLSESTGSIHVIRSRTCTRVALIQHHVMVDGASRAVLAETIDDLVAGDAPPPADDLWAAMRESLELENEAASRAEDVLKPLATIGESDPPVDGSDFFVHRAADHELATELREAADAQGFSFAGALLWALRHQHGAPLIGVAVSTRPRADTRVVGCFVNTVPVAMPAPATPREATAALRAAARERHVPVTRLEVMARRAGTPLGLSHRPLASVASLATAADVVLLDSDGHRPGLFTARLWETNEEIRITIEHAGGLQSDEGAAFATGLLDGLRRLARPG